MKNKTLSILLGSSALFTSGLFADGNYEIAEYNSQAAEYNNQAFCFEKAGVMVCLSQDEILQAAKGIMKERGPESDLEVYSSLLNSIEFNKPFDPDMLEAFLLQFFASDSASPFLAAFGDKWADELSGASQWIAEQLGFEAPEKRFELMIKLLATYITLYPEQANEELQIQISGDLIEAGMSHQEAMLATERLMELIYNSFVTEEFSMADKKKWKYSIATILYYQDLEDKADRAWDATYDSLFVQDWTKTKAAYVTSKEKLSEGWSATQKATKENWNKLNNWRKDNGITTETAGQYANKAKEGLAKGWNSVKGWWNKKSEE